MKNIELHHGDCLDVLRGMADCSIDAVVTDPPYGLSFMGNKWDYDVPAMEVWAECLRVLKPGGHLLAFAGTRTQHRMAVRIEDAGFEIRDMIAWVYGSGFPKSRNLDGDWQGWGTALKPALEPITVARKPLVGTVAENVLAHGTGALNIDGCRVSMADGEENPSIARYASTQQQGNNGWGHVNRGARFDGSAAESASLGRWPANLIHDGSEEVLAGFPDAKGATSNSSKGGGLAGTDTFKMRERGKTEGYGDAGSAARFFYCAKASKRDRDEGLDAMPTVTADPYGQHRGRRMNGNDTRIDGKPPATGKNNHPTVKPTDLMRYLCRLVTPPGGVVLDPFMGSGSTGKAAILEGFRFVGIEREAQYVEIARARIDAANASMVQSQTQPDLFLLALSGAETEPVVRSA